MAASINPRPIQPYAAMAMQGTMEAVVDALPRLWPAVFAWLAERGITPTGAPFILYRGIFMPDRMSVEVGIPTASVGESDTQVICGELPAGDYVEALYIGHYDGLMQATADLLQWGDEQNLSWDAELLEDKQHWVCRFESYLTDPESEPDPDKWQTQLSIKIV